MRNRRLRSGRGRVHGAALVFSLLAVGAHGAPAAAAPSTEDPRVSEVWGREADYWRFLKAGDVDSYVSLWHEKFIGWPCGQEHPKLKASIGDWVREVRDERISVAAELTREGAEAFGDVVVVHYQFTKVDTYPDGHVEGLGERSKITHTWMKVGGTWQIIGGMCGALPDRAG